MNLNVLQEHLLKFQQLPTTDHYLIKTIMILHDAL